MAYKIEKDERNITYDAERKQFMISIDQVQVADPSNFISMVKSWETQLGKATKFIEEEAKYLEAAKKEVDVKHADTLERVKKEKENLQSSIMSFSPALSLFKENHPDVFKKAMEKLEKPNK